MKNSFSFLAKHISWKYIVLILILIYIILLTVPYLPHKTVSEEYKEKDAAAEYYSDTSGTERIAYITDNNDALLYRLGMIEEAEKSIILSTFDFNDDEAGQDILSALLNAADRGVDIRVIVDGISGFMDVQHNPWFLALDAHKNAQVRIYNPVNFLKPWDMQARLHDKYLIIDDQMYTLGGRNTTNLFLGDYSKGKNIDKELFVYETDPGKNMQNTSMSQLQTYFDSIWDSSDSKPCRGSRNGKKTVEKTEALKKHYKELQKKYPAAYEKQNWEELTFETNKITLLSNPIKSENKEPWMWYSLHRLMMSGKQATIYTPYIICGREMYDDLSQLTDNNVSVEIITNDVAKGANPWGCTDYLNEKEKIWRTGVKVYEYMAPHSCHTKAVLIDDRMSIVGSYNLDMRSTYLDTELMLAVDSTELNAIIRKEAEHDKTFSKTMANGKYTYGENYKTKELSTGKKLFYATLRQIIKPLRRFL